MSMEQDIAAPAQAQGPGRVSLMACGFANVGLGIIGAVVPGMPTTVFLLIALWAFSRSSPRFHRWLYTHPRLGPTLRAWREHRAIPLRAKILAAGTMALSVTIVATQANGWTVPLAVGLPLAFVAGWIVSRPSRPALRL